MNQSASGDLRDVVDRAIERRCVRFDGELNRSASTARISSSVAGGSKLNSVLMLRHMSHGLPAAFRSLDSSLNLAGLVACGFSKGSSPHSTNPRLL